MKGKRSRAQIISRSTGLKSLARSVGRRKLSAIARQTMRNRGIRTHVLRVLAGDIQREMKEMCAVKTGKHIGSPLCTCIMLFPLLLMKYKGSGITYGHSVNGHH